MPTKSNVKLANGKMVHSQEIGVVLCCFGKFPIIYLVGPVYYFPARPFNTILFCALKWYSGSQNITYEPLERCDFVYPQGNYWISP